MDTPVVAVSGLSGAGKSALVGSLREAYPASVALYFDDYASVSRYPPDLRDWLDRGGDVDEWDVSTLVADIQRLRRGEPVTPPNADRPIQPGVLILLEQPLGRLHAGMAPLIDLSVHVDLPLDLLLMRRLHRLIHEEGGAQDPDLWRRIAGHLDHYRELGRDLSLHAHERLVAAADLVLDGRASVAALTLVVREEIERRRSEGRLSAPSP